MNFGVLEVECWSGWPGRLHRQLLYVFGTVLVCVLMSRSEPIPPRPITVLNDSMLSTWYDSTQCCMIRDLTTTRTNITRSNSSFWELLWGCEKYLASLPENNGSKPFHRYGSGFNVLPSSAFSRKARDGCCNSDVHVRDRGFDWVWEGFEDGSKQTQCIALFTELSRHNKSILLLGDSMNNQVYFALIEECNREGIRGSFDGGAKGSIPWVQNPEAHGLTRKTIAYVGAIYRFDWDISLRRSSDSAAAVHYNNSIYFYTFDIWYGRRGVFDERILMEALVPLVCRNHPGGLVILPNIGHHLEAERMHNNFHTMVETVSNFLNWMHELTKINWGKNIVAFRETTPSHFDSPDHDGSFEKWKGAGRSNYDYMAKNPWDDEKTPSPLYHCRTINTSSNPAKNTLENFVVADIIKTWGKKRSSIRILHVFKYLAPFYRLKYGFCGGYDRYPVLDCVHFCAWGPTMWIPIWDELLKLVRDWAAAGGVGGGGGNTTTTAEGAAASVDEDKGGLNYEPVFGRMIVEDVIILRRCDGSNCLSMSHSANPTTTAQTQTQGVSSLPVPVTGPIAEELYLYYHGVRHTALDFHSIEQELGILKNSSAFPLIKNVTSEEISKILVGSPVEFYPVLKDGSAIQAHGDNQIWYLNNGSRHAVPNWDTFCSLGFGRGSIIHVSLNVIERIKVGDGVPPHDWPTNC